jgi:surface protein
VNLDSIAIDSPIISTTSLYRCFRNCTSLTGGISNWNVSNVTNFTETFLSANSFTGDITQWNVSSGTTFTRMFGSNSGFNQDISGWDVSSATRMDYMFQNATSFDQNLATWNITSIDSALAGATFGSMVGMFSGVTLSTSNYDAILIGWESQGVNGVKFDGGNSKYTAGGPAEAARSSLINTYGWTISDGGSV